MIEFMEIIIILIKNSILVPSKTTICVGTINNISLDNELTKEDSAYNIGYISNYDSCVDIFARVSLLLSSFPPEVDESKPYNIYTYVYGTSYSTPFTASAVAVLISKNLEVAFDQTVLKQWLFDFFLKDVIGDLDRKDTLNRFINIGKKVFHFDDEVNNGCGIHAGIRGCCSASGYYG